ncbi:MAG: PqiC family protein [Desulfobacteraceae bacterium]
MRQNNPLFNLFLLTLFASLLLTGGCSTATPSNFYLLTPVNRATVEKTDKPLCPEITLTLGPVTVPDHLDRHQIVVRTNPNILELSDYNRWAGALARELPLVLRENLSLLLATDQIALYPAGRDLDADFQVSVDIVQFDGLPGEEIRLVARWQLVDLKTDRTMAMERTEASRPLESKEYQAYVAGQSSLLETLCYDIALGVKEICPGGELQQ